ncbi:MAG: hypothetical protein IJU84_08490, partial [Clostridia bacterium]|nr:hypothetical protein [Clostridia bacterium]
MNDREFHDKLVEAYETAKKQVIGDTFKKLRMEFFCREYSPEPEWSVGPFTQEDGLTYTKTVQMPDPTGIGWRSGFIFNPSLLVENDTLYLFYRAAVKKESLCSRIGLAVYTEGEGWKDCGCNPLIYPTEKDEILTIDDPKVYRANGRYYMFYNAGYYADSATAEKYGKNTNEVCVNIKLAVSEDKLHWQKKGLVVPLEISRLWAKGAVIPRDGAGNAVKLNGKYYMFLSEGCGGKQYVGSSYDMESWEFEQIDYLIPTGDVNIIHEVACSIVIDEGRFVLDYFYSDKEGVYHAGQALYSTNEPFNQKDTHTGGSLAWGGMSVYKGKWIFPQGWNSPDDKEEMYFYTCPVKSEEYKNTDGKRSDEFFKDGFFDWQYSGKQTKEAWETRRFDPDLYWGDFEKPVPSDYSLPVWTIKNFTKYEGNPVFAPDPEGWDCGYHSGGVHNGSVVFHDGKYWYIYRGERPYRKIETKEISGDIDLEIDYICDIGVAVSNDGINFKRVKGSLFRNGEDEKYSFEDVCCVRYNGTYYL